MKYFIEDTTLTNIADAVREKEESTQTIPVVELADRIRDIQTGSTVGKQLNDDGTQNVFVDDTKGDTIDTNKPIASVKYNGVEMDLVGGSGEITITENGTHDVTQYASANVNVQSAPVLLWTNASPNSSFAAQYLSVPQYDTIIVESAFNINNGARKTITVLEFSKGINRIVCENGSTQYALRDVSYSGNSLYIGNGLSGSTVNNLCIPLRIWGANFTL